MERSGVTKKKKKVALNIGYFWELFFLFFFNCCSSTVVSISCPSFPLTLDILTVPPRSYPPLALFMCPLYMFLTTLPHPPLSLPASPLVIVSLFFISMSLVIFCLLVCCLDSSYRSDHMVIIKLEDIEINFFQNLC